MTISTNARAQSRSGPTDSSSRLWREIRAVNDSLVQALLSGDPKRAARFYTDDARIDGPGGRPVIGRAAVDQYWAAVRDAKSWKLDVIQVGGHPSEPWQIGRSTLVTGSGENMRTSIVDFLGVWRRQTNGSLRLAIDYWRESR